MFQNLNPETSNIFALIPVGLDIASIQNSRPYWIKRWLKPVNVFDNLLQEKLDFKRYNSSLE